MLQWRYMPTLCIAALACLLLGAAQKEDRQEPPPAVTRGALIRFEGFIGPGNRVYLQRKLEAAKEDGVNLVIIEIESGGGRVDSSMEIAEMLRDLHWAHTVAYVPNMALSGAAVVALGCDEIILGPHAVLGDVGVIFVGGDSLFHYVPEKRVSPFLQWIRDLAASKGRPPALAEAMVDKKLIVYRFENEKTGKLDYVSQRDLDAHPDQWKQWKQLGRVAQSGGDRFLTVSGKDGVELGLARGVASSRAEVKARYPLEGELLVLEPGGIDTAVQILNSSWITALLLIIGLVGLYMEFSSPGIGIGGLLAAICFATFFWSHFLGGTASRLAAVLFLLGMTCLAVELFILPGFAVGGIVGAVLIIASLILAIQGFFIPQTSEDLATLMQTLVVVFCSGVSFVVAAVFISKRFGSLPLFRRLMLPPPEPADVPRVALAGALGATADAVLGPQAPPIALGQTGIAQSALRPAGKARFGNRYVDVVTDGTFIATGSRVKVVRIGDNRVVVEEAE
jgi:membrane-bound serine protease (ClpP class)